MQIVSTELNNPEVSAIKINDVYITDAGSLNKSKSLASSSASMKTGKIIFFKDRISKNILNKNFKFLINFY